MESSLRQDENLENGNHFLTESAFDAPNRYFGRDWGKQSVGGVAIVICFLLKTETARLNAQIVSAERDLESDVVPEDIRGKLRVAVGKANMLLRKKFVQFRDLCYKNLGAESDVRYPVTSEDLAGYWDTIVIQILQVYKIFDEVDILRKNNWEEPSIKTINQSREKKMAAKLNRENNIITEAV